MDSCAKVGVQQGCTLQGSGPEILQGSGVGLQDVPMGVGGVAMVGRVRAGEESAVTKGDSVNLMVVDAMREGVGTSAACETK